MKLIIGDGIAYQENRTKSVRYSKAYYNKLVEYDNRPKQNNKINKLRVDLVQAHCSDGDVLDIGCGTGRFMTKLKKVRSKCAIDGYDINKESLKWLIENNCLGNLKDIEHYNVITFWDSLEHIPEPGEILEKVKENAYTFISIPIISDFGNIKKSVHYRPNEHYWYFNIEGLKAFMEKYDFEWQGADNFETSKGGRTDIWSFVFRKK